MSQKVKLELHPSGNEAANGNSADFENVNADGPAVLYVNVSASGGTSPTLDLTLNERDPASDVLEDSGVTIPQITGNGMTRVAIEYLYGTIYQLAWVIGGTASPNFTFTAMLVAKDRG